MYSCSQGGAGSQEGVVEKLLEGHPLHRVALEQAVDEIDASRTQVPGNLVWDLGFMALYVVQ